MSATPAQASPARKPARNARSRAREFALQGLYQVLVGRQAMAQIDDFTQGLAGFGKADSVYYDTTIFATVFQFFFLRLAVFFGCVGVFTNLFRGELLDKSLHYYLLTPLRREVLVAGKYIAGLIATTVIFCTSTVLQIWALSLHFDASEIADFLNGGGWGQIAAYTGVTAAACLGYGSVFLAAGLLFKNPIVPAAVVVTWEGLGLPLVNEFRKEKGGTDVPKVAPIPL